MEISAFIEGDKLDVYHKRTAQAYAVFGASREAGMDDSVFPDQCPWTFEQAMNADFWPEPDINDHSWND